MRWIVLLQTSHVNTEHPRAVESRLKGLDPLWQRQVVLAFRAKLDERGESIVRMWTHPAC